MKLMLFCFTESKIALYMSTGLKLSQIHISFLKLKCCLLPGGHACLCWLRHDRWDCICCWTAEVGTHSEQTENHYITIEDFSFCCVSSMVTRPSQCSITLHCLNSLKPEKTAVSDLYEDIPEHVEDKLIRLVGERGTHYRRMLHRLPTPLICQRGPARNSIKKEGGSSDITG